MVLSTKLRNKASSRWIVLNSHQEIWRVSAFQPTSVELIPIPAITVVNKKMSREINLTDNSIHHASSSNLSFKTCSTILQIRGTMSRGVACRRESNILQIFIKGKKKWWAARKYKKSAHILFKNCRMKKSKMIAMGMKMINKVNLMELKTKQITVLIATSWSTWPNLVNNYHPLESIWISDATSNSSKLGRVSIKYRNSRPKIQRLSKIKKRSKFQKKGDDLLAQLVTRPKRCLPSSEL